MEIKPSPPDAATCGGKIKKCACAAMLSRMSQMIITGDLSLKRATTKRDDFLYFYSCKTKKIPVHARKYDLPAAYLLAIAR